VTHILSSIRPGGAFFWRSEISVTSMFEYREICQALPICLFDSKAIILGLGNSYL